MTHRARLIGLTSGAIVVAMVVSAAAGELASLHVKNPVLAASLARLSLGSASWRDAMDTVSRTGRRILVVTPENIRVRDEKTGRDKPFDPDVLAEVQPIAVGHKVDTAIVVINLPLLEQLYRDATTADMHADLDRILAHEVYGHAIPYLLAGDLAGKCADPLPGQRATDACAIQRENVIRTELKLGQRREYGLYGLAMSRRFRN